MEMLLTGDLINAEQAEKFGLINRSVPHIILQEETLNLAKIIAEKPLYTLKTGKKAFYKQLEMSMEKAYDYTSKVMLDNMLHKESEEGIGAFLEKRKPNWE